MSRNTCWMTGCAWWGRTSARVCACLGTGRVSLERQYFERWTRGSRGTRLRERADWWCEDWYCPRDCERDRECVRYEGYHYLVPRLSRVGRRFTADSSNRALAQMQEAAAAAIAHAAGVAGAPVSFLMLSKTDDAWSDRSADFAGLALVGRVYAQIRGGAGSGRKRLGCRCDEGAVRWHWIFPPRCEAQDGAGAGLWHAGEGAGLPVGVAEGDTLFLEASRCGETALRIDVRHGPAGGGAASGSPCSGAAELPAGAMAAWPEDRWLCVGQWWTSRSAISARSR